MGVPPQAIPWGYGVLGGAELFSYKVLNALKGCGLEVKFQLNHLSLDTWKSKNSLTKINNYTTRKPHTLPLKGPMASWLPNSSCETVFLGS